MEIQHCLICQQTTHNVIFSCVDNNITKEQFQIAECTHCGFRFTLDKPEESAIGPYYAANAYTSYKKKSEHNLFDNIYAMSRTFMLKYKLGIIKKYASLSTTRLIDYGCGIGTFAHFMKSHVRSVKGFEISAEARHIASSEYQLQVQSPNVLKDESAQSVDVITMWHVLEHIYQPDTLLQTFQKILVDGGKLVIAVPNYQSFDGAYYKQDWVGYDVPRHLWHFSPDSMKILVERNGFALKQMHLLPLDPFFCSFMSEKNRKNPIAGPVGLIKGSFFWLRSMFQTTKASSLVYVFEKPV